MSRSLEFTYGPYHIDEALSTISIKYSAELENGNSIEYVDTVTFPGVTETMWKRVPEALLSALAQSLVLVHGIPYWKHHPTSSVRIEGFALTKKQSQFWNVLYLNELGEFFYRSKIDFRGLISFPYVEGATISAVDFPGQQRLLLAVGGGKDSIVSAEMLSQAGLPFDLFASNPVGIQERVAALIGRPLIAVKRKKDPKLQDRKEPHQRVEIYASLSATVFQSVSAAILHGYRYIIFSNEQSADIGNLSYLGLDVNHQWCKSSEAERLIAEYISSFITPDVTHFSLLRQFTELELTRRFTKYPKYFRTFSSCNMNSIIPHMTEYKSGHGYWCKRCPKCVFIFACLSAFLPKDTVIDIVGGNLYANPQLLPVFRQLLGLEGFKPFDCVGVPDEMFVAMRLAGETHAYDADCAMQSFYKSYPAHSGGHEGVRNGVFSSKTSKPIPQLFIPCLSTPT